MNKKILSLALVSMSLFPLASMAQNKVCGNECVAPQENVCNKECTKEFKKQRCNPFEGINLNESQKSKIDKIMSDRKAARKEKAKAAKEAKKAEKTARLAERKNSRKEYIKQIKEVLTPEQYVIFLENIVVNSHDNFSGRKPDRKHHMGIAKHDRIDSRYIKEGKKYRMNKNAEKTSVDKIAKSEVSVK